MIFFWLPPRRGSPEQTNPPAPAAELICGICAANQRRNLARSQRRGERLWNLRQRLLTPAVNESKFIYRSPCLTLAMLTRCRNELSRLESMIVTAGPRTRLITVDGRQRVCCGSILCRESRNLAAATLPAPLVSLLSRSLSCLLLGMIYIGVLLLRMTAGSRRAPIQQCASASSDSHSGWYRLHQRQVLAERQIYRRFKVPPRRHFSGRLSL